MPFDRVAYMKEWRSKNRDKRNESNKRWKLKDPEGKKLCYRRAGLKYNFGLSIEQYDNMLEEQKECCAICGRHQSLFKKRLAVDHCHTTGKIRKLLCARCNVDLGIYENRKEEFEDYLRKEGETYSKRKDSMD